jgi:hypothetical protein
MRCGDAVKSWLSCELSRRRIEDMVLLVTPFQFLVGRQVRQLAE